jgi:hypothetical protein
MIKKRLLANGRFTMTLPDERYRAVIQTRRFLFDLCNPNHTPRVPKLIRETARSMLRHYPSEYEMRRAAEGAPDVFQERMEPLYRMVKQYEQDKTDNT